jgi:hypothetical protein
MNTVVLQSRVVGHTAHVNNVALKSKVGVPSANVNNVLFQRESFLSNTAIIKQGGDSLSQRQSGILK